MIDRIATWVFRRYRRHYLIVLEVVGDVFSVVGIILIPLVTVTHYLGFSLSEIAIAIGATTVIICGSVRASIVVNRRTLNTYRRWLRGEPVDPEEIWRLTLTFISPLVGTAFWIAAGLAAPFSILVLGRYAELDGLVIVAIMAGLVGLALGGYVVIFQGYQIFARPPTRLIAEDVPIGAVPPPPGLSLSARLTMATMSSCILLGICSICWAGNIEDDGDQLAVAALATYVVAGYLVTIVRLGVIDTSFRPLGDVVAATKRVREGDFSAAVPVTTTDEFGQLAFAVNDMQRGLREREALQTAFGSYVDPALAKRLLAEGDAVFESEEIDVSVFFADIRGFTEYTESTSVRDAVATLNRFFAIVVRVVTDHGGHTNAYLGDGVLAVFGTPQALDDHADRAVAAAVAVQRAVTEAFGESLRIGIGVNSGRVIAGTVGGEGKLEYTVIGDAVNVAARIEQLTKATGDGILLTEATFAAMTRDVGVSERGEFDVRGKQRRVTLFAL